MASKVKGIYKTFKFVTQIFVVKERDMEIGYPTDVKHVAHIGFDGPSGTGPSWMNEFKTAPDFSTSIGERRDLNPPMSTTTAWSTKDCQEATPSGGVPKKPRRKKIKSTCPTKSSSRQPKAPKSKAAHCETEAATAIVQV